MLAFEIMGQLRIYLNQNKAGHFCAGTFSQNCSVTTHVQMRRKLEVVINDVLCPLVDGNGWWERES